jgi:hypothetical protein
MKDYEKERVGLYNQLKLLEDEQEQFQRLMIKSKEICDMQTESVMRRFYFLEEMRLNNPSNPELLNVLSYNHEVISSMKKHNEQFYHDFDETHKKKQREWSMREEDIYQELQHLQQEQDEYNL